MKNVILFAMCIAFFATWVSATVFVSGTKPHISDIEDREDMVVM